MTLAAVLAATVCGTSSTPGIVHDPLSPLVLGDVLSGSFSVLSYDAINNKLVMQVTKDDTVSQYTFDTLGNITINDVNIANNPQIAAAVLAAQNAAAASAASAAAAAGSATTATGAVSAAQEEANNAETSAILSGKFASAPETEPLPGGGVSSLVSSQRAESVSQLSRDLNNGADVTGDETYQPGFLFTERQVTAAGLVTITVPPNIFTSTEKKQRWGSYRLRNATGSIRFIPQAGTTTVTAPTLVASAKAINRFASSTNVAPQNLACTIAIPNVTSGKVVVMYSGTHNGAPLTFPASAVVSSPDFPTWSPLRAYPANVAFNGVPEIGIYTADLTAFVGKTVTITVAGGDNLRIHMMGVFIVSGHGSAGQAITAPLNSNLTAFPATLAAVPAQSLVLGFGLQRAITTESVFSSFDANLALIPGLGNDSRGQPDLIVGDGDRSKNLVYAFGRGVQTVDGAFLGKINFSGATGPGNMSLVSFAPVAGSAPAVVIEAEGNRDTMSVPFGVAELWFQNDGTKVSLRTPKP